MERSVASESAVKSKYEAPELWTECFGILTDVICRSEPEPFVDGDDWGFDDIY